MKFVCWLESKLASILHLVSCDYIGGGRLSGG